jgi:murein DD-endopeptidase MepM/ murein hydrolase activator NlpD
MLRILLFFFLIGNFSFAQLTKNEANVLNIESNDYWETELSPLSNLSEIVQFIHADPFRNLFISNIPAGNPLLRDISVNSFYGTRGHPIHKILKFHRGIDLKGKLGESVVASGGGKVIETGELPDLGKFVKIQHKYGFESIYGHLSTIKIKKGSIVEKGQLLGKVGATGKVTGPHLHYTLKKNEVYLDPFDFLFMNFEKEF